MSAPHLAEFAQLVSGPVGEYVAASGAIGGIVQQQAQLVKQAFEKEYAFLLEAAKMQKPSDDEVGKMIAPIGEIMGSIQKIAADTPPSDEFFNHVSAWSESIPALGWVMAESKPVPFVADFEGAGEFYTSKLLMKFKGTENAKAHQAWVRAVKAVYEALKAYIKSFHTTKLTWNLGLDASAGASGAGAGDEDDDEEEDAGGADPISAFQQIIDGPVKNYVAASAKIGTPVQSQATFVLEAFEKELEFLKTAAKTAKPADGGQSMVGDVGACMGKVGEFASSVGPREPLFNHVSVIAESVSILGWVVVPSGVIAYMSDCEGAGDFYVTKVQVAAKKAENGAKELEWVATVKEMYTALKAYVKEHFTTGLTWNFASAPKPKKVKKPKAAAVDDDDGDADGPDAFSAFQSIVDGPLAAYVSASKTLGGEVEKQAEAYKKAWLAEVEFLKKAGSMAKPADGGQSMVAEVGAEMGKVMEIVGAIGPREPFFNHCTAISESVNVLAWVVVDSKPLPFISDAEGAGEFYLSKVMMTYKKADDGAPHMEWVNTVKALYAALKAYVKDYHMTALTWNFMTNKPKKAKAGGAKRASSSSSSSASLEEFKALVEGPVKATYGGLSLQIGGQVAEQAKIVIEAFEKQLVFLTQAASMAKPSSQDGIMSMLRETGQCIGRIQDIQNAIHPRDAEANHVTAIGESIPALSWVVMESKPVPFITEMEGAGDFYLNKVLMDAKKLDNVKVHQEWVRSVRGIFAALKKFVKDHHTTCLVWNTGAGGGGAVAAGDAEDAMESSAAGGDSISDFEALLVGPLQKFLDLSKSIGSFVEEQAVQYAEVWKKELDFLKSASSMKKPADDEVQAMMTPIGLAMAEVNNIKDKAPPRDELVNHLTAMAESVPALGWVALDSKPIPYVADMAGAGEMYLNRVLQAFKTKDDAQLHKDWVATVKTLYEELKKYIKAHHTTSLQWGSK
ncbi:Adenylyl cyclase-associated protein 1 [Porphyridium purpureum]|uniref:Adenylyl cyclase-associated protein 1 n=1 Tax=Porphyridium purpureum TaxID=35688 RepID=A0A5J4Z733_PORPP|nr:Adenylyl cyclase-associated protein 1 [Porphyridium purpureum]|eukprot:POR0336..scf295_1